MSDDSAFAMLTREEQKRVRLALLRGQRLDDPDLRAGLRSFAPRYRRQMYWVTLMLPVYAGVLVLAIDRVSGAGTVSISEPSFVFAAVITLSLLAVGWVGMVLWTRRVVRVNRS